ncbi:hypothetical protein [uncultured Marinobacter sp.]|uniref:hypothetical protein n=1 Tax=uncultured Marinobacter sp. TaxID=187379 RepID=UPI002592268E|nr:hypothetical protein [uncultured Marinobacter sp.]
MTTLNTGPGGQMFASQARRVVANEKREDAVALFKEAFKDVLKPIIERIEALEEQIAPGTQTGNQSQGDAWANCDLNAPIDNAQQEEAASQEAAANKAQSPGDWDKPGFDLNNLFD